MLTRRQILAGAAATAAVAAIPAVAIAAVEGAPAIYGWAEANLAMKPLWPGLCPRPTTIQKYQREFLDALMSDDVIVITRMPDVAQGAVPRKIDGAVAAGRKS